MIYEKQKTQNVSFPLGGIGSGSIGLAGNGELIDWEIFNRPNKNSRNEYSHFAIKATSKNNNVTKVLHGDTNENLSGMIDRKAGFGHGVRGSSLAGFNHFKNVSFDGTFPIANLTFSDEDFPGVVKLLAFNPFIPHDDYNSSLPVAFFEWEIQNNSNEEVEYSLGFTVCNPSMLAKHDAVTSKSGNGVYLGSYEDKNSIKYSDLCVLTDGEDYALQQYWYRGAWQDAITTYWKNFTTQNRLENRVYDGEYQRNRFSRNKKDHATVASYVTIKPNESKKVRFVLAWNVPNAYNYWESEVKEGELTWLNYYATQFSSSRESALYAIENFSALLSKTEQFTSALFSCTLPSFVKDAISSNLSVIKSPTALRIQDGSFWGWEGCNETYGSCLGTCQHVWNYAYVMPYLFPKLERSIREMTMNVALDGTGGTRFRINLPLERNYGEYRACVDGQMGEVIKCYREWKFSGDDNWLKTYADKIFSMLEYAWSDENKDKWDADCDGVLEGRQHHTLDLELFSPSSWLEGFYLLALDCGAKMAKHLGDDARFEKYTELYNKGKKWTNENLFNGEYFYQKIDLTDKSLIDRFEDVDYYWNDEVKEIKYQVAEGCIIDQMLSDWHAVLIGADGIFDTDKKKRALESLFKHNYKDSMRTVTNMWRNFALNDESATIICSYPNPEKTPTIPISYCEEAMTGFEYSLAGLMIANGMIEEGEKMVKAVRDRYDGEKRNPWNEIECGCNYARSMSSFALMPIYCGFTFDMTRKHVGFAPITKQGKYLFSVCESWGVVEFDEQSFTLSSLGNPLTLSSISLPNNSVKTVIVDGKEIDFTTNGNEINLNNVTIYKELKVL